MALDRVDSLLSLIGVELLPSDFTDYLVADRIQGKRRSGESEDDLESGDGEFHGESIASRVVTGFNSLQFASRKIGIHLRNCRWLRDSVLSNDVHELE